MKKKTKNSFSKCEISSSLMVYSNKGHERRTTVSTANDHYFAEKNNTHTRALRMKEEEEKQIEKMTFGKIEIRWPMVLRESDEAFTMAHFIMIVLPSQLLARWKNTYMWFHRTIPLPECIQRKFINKLQFSYQITLHSGRSTGSFIIRCVFPPSSCRVFIAKTLGNNKFNCSIQWCTELILHQNSLIISLVVM